MKIRSLGLVLLAVLVTGCHTTITRRLVVEDAVVVDLRYAPAQHGSSSSITFSGKPSFGSVDIPAAYGVAVESPLRGKFTVEGSNGEALWKLARAGDHVAVSWEETVETNDRTGQSRVVNFAPVSFQVKR